MVIFPIWNSIGRGTRKIYTAHNHNIHLLSFQGCVLSVFFDHIHSIHI